MLWDGETGIVVVRTHPELLKPSGEFGGIDEAMEDTLGVMPHMSKPGGRVFWREGIILKGLSRRAFLESAEGGGAGGVMNVRVR